MPFSGGPAKNIRSVLFKNLFCSASIMLICLSKHERMFKKTKMGGASALNRKILFKIEILLLNSYFPRF